MKSLVFLLSCFTLAFNVKAYPQLTDQHLKALESSYPGAGGSIDNRMILDSASLYYSHQPSSEDLKVWSSVYKYDARLNKIEEINYKRDSMLNIMEKENRYVYAYDANGYQTEWAYYFWDSQINEWAGLWRNFYIYDFRSNMVALISYDWDPQTSCWINGWRKVECTFDANNKLIEKIIYEWDSTRNDRAKNKRYTYKYDSRGNQVADTCYRWDLSTSSWNREYLIAYLYDSRSRMTGKYSSGWDSEANKWVQLLRNVYSYDGSSNLINEIIYDYNSTINNWRVRYCYEYKYDGSKNLIEQVRKSCDPFTYAWRFDERYVNIYNDNGNVTERISYHWKPEINNWEETEKLVSSWSYPFINDQSFYLNEKSINGSLIGNIITGSTYNHEKITFQLVDGNKDNLFKIDTVTGEIFLINPQDLDYDTDSCYNLTVEAHFLDSTISIKQRAKIRIYVNNVNDIAPEVIDTIFNITDSTETSAVSMKSTSLIKFYPNPATDILFLEIPDNSGKGFEVELINLSGQVIFSQSEFTEQIDVTQFQTGIYFVKVRVENKEMIAGRVMISPNH